MKYKPTNLNSSAFYAVDAIERNQLQSVVKNQNKLCGQDVRGSTSKERVGL